MHHVVLERWSRGTSFLHRRDARSKVAVTGVFLVLLATAHRDLTLLAPAYFAVLVGAAFAARLPIAGALGRSAAVLPFALVFALISAAAGDPTHAAVLVVKSYLSALAVLLLVATTPLPELLRGLEKAGVPRFMLMVAQMLYRYLFVISEEAQHMRVAGLSRGWSAGRFRAAAGALAVLFARSFARAEAIQRAMLARGFEGHFPALHSARFGVGDLGFTCAAAAILFAMRFAIEVRV